MRFTNQPNQVCLVMTADCFASLFTNKQGTEVAAAHAGWRGLCDGILEETVKCFQSAPRRDYCVVWACYQLNAFPSWQRSIDNLWLLT